MEVFVRDRRRVPRGADRRLASRVRVGISFLDADAGAESPQHLDLLAHARDLS